MGIPLRARRILALVGFMAIGVAVTATVLAQQVLGGSGDETAAGRTAVTTEQLAAAVDIARNSDKVPQAARNQRWEPKLPWPLDVKGREHVVLFYVEWQSPISLSGEWSHVQCQGTRIRSYSARVDDVTTLSIAVDLDAREVVAASYSLPVPPEVDEDRPVPSWKLIGDKPVRSIDPESGSTLQRLSEGDDFPCPAGRTDD